MYKLVIGILFVSGLNSASGQTLDIIWQNSLGGTGSEDGYSIIQAPDSSIFVLAYSSTNDGDVTGNHGAQDFWLVKLFQDGTINWQKSLGGSTYDVPQCIINTRDSSIVVIGDASSSDGDFEPDELDGTCLVMKLDLDGNILWQEKFGGIHSENGKSIIQLPDGGFAFTGYSRSDEGDFPDHHGSTDYNDLIVGRIDENGEKIWTYSYGSGNDDMGEEIIFTSDSNLLIVGTSDISLYDFEYYILKLNLDGDVLWSKKYGGSATDQAYSVVELSPGKYLVTGFAYSEDGDVTDSHGNEDAWTLLLDENGEIIWKRAYGGSYTEAGNQLILIDTNTIVISGAASSTNGDVTNFDGELNVVDYWLFAIDTLGIIKWQGCFGGSGLENALSIIYVGDSAFITTGHSNSFDGDVVGHHGLLWSDAWTVKVKLNCNPIQYYKDWDSDGYGNPAVYIYSCVDSAGYVLNDADCDDSLYYVYPGAVELLNGLDDDCDGVSDEGLDLKNITQQSITIYPVPADGYIMISTIIQKPAMLRIISQSGAVVREFERWDGEVLPIDTLAAGVYFLQIQNAGIWMNGYFIKE